MKATILYMNNESEIITARNAKSLSNKLYKKRVMISEIDIILLSLKAGYSDIDRYENRKTIFKSCRINIQA